jgi:hypothetical protein
MRVLQKDGHPKGWPFFVNAEYAIIEIDGRISM